MANLRVVYDNAAQRATISASTTAGTLAASNLLTDPKSAVWRSTGTTATLTLTWPTAESIKMFSLPFASLTATATIRVRGYTVPGDSSAVFDTGSVLATQHNFGATLNANSYGYGGGVYATLWFIGANVRQLIVTVTDTSNSNGYVEAARVVTGSYWSPSNNCEYGADMNYADLSKHERSDAGDLRTDVGPRYRALTMDLAYMPATDRNTFWRLIKLNGMSKPVFVSLTPENTDDAAGEAIHQVYGKLSRISAIKYQFLNQFNSRLEIEEI